MSENSPGPGELGIMLEQTGLSRNESSSYPEKLKISNRVLVYGSRVSGAFQLAEEFENYLKERDIPATSVEVCRNAHSIEDAFYDRRAPTPPAETTWVNPPSSNKGIARLAQRGVELFRGRTSREESPKPAEISQDTLPTGVIVLPEMRQSGPGGLEMTI